MKPENTLMTCIEISEPGGPEVLKPVQRPIPEPQAGEVLVRVKAAGVNRPDVMQRQGRYAPPPGASDLPGLEIAGTVVSLGPGVENLQVGDEICALVHGGGYAQYCLAAASLCLPIPKGLNAIQAAGIPETFFTVWTNVFMRGRLKPGERVLVHGGSSGIGTTAIQLIRNFGCEVYITAGSQEKCDACIGLGANAAINYRTQDFVAEVAALTQNRGVDLILDMVGGDYFPRNLDCLAQEGRLVQIAMLHGPKSEINLLKIMQKCLTVTGSTLRPRSLAEKTAIARALLEHVWPQLEAGRIQPLIHAQFPLEGAALAHSLIDSGEHIGKIILTCDQL